MCVPEHSHPCLPGAGEPPHLSAASGWNQSLSAPYLGAEQMVLSYKLLWSREAEGEPAQRLLLLKDVDVLQFSVGLFLLTTPE